MRFTEVDHWIGKTLFVPPIIKLCQLTRQSQFAVSRLFWFIAALDGFYRAETLFGAILWGGMSILAMLSAARRADSPITSFMFFRLVAIALLVLDLARSAAMGTWASAEFWLFDLDRRICRYDPHHSPAAIVEARYVRTRSLVGYVASRCQTR